MAGKQVDGDGVPSSLAGLSKAELYDIMSQMKTVIELNKPQARQILIQNPALTRALFQAQIMLGMVQSPQAAPAVSSSTTQNPQPLAIPNQQSNVAAASPFPAQIGARKHQAEQTMITSKPEPQPIPIPVPSPQSTLSHPLQLVPQPKAHLGVQSSPLGISQTSQVPLTSLTQHTASQPSHHQTSMPFLPAQLQLPAQSQLPTQSQLPIQTSGSHYLPLQPPLPPQPRPQMPAFPHQVHPQMGQNLGFQQSAGPQPHHSQHMFHSGAKPSAGVGPLFPQGQPSLPIQPLPPSIYQAGGPHVGIGYNQVESSKQTDGGSSWMPGPLENKVGIQLPGPSPSYPSQMGPSSQPPRPPPLTPELEKALLQQVMSLTQEQINMLPAEQRNQVLQLQQMLRQ